MARPLLADPDFVNKAAANQANEINTCIGCNQACLDHIFLGKKASCLVNPRAAYESTLHIKPVAPGKKQKVAVVGAGPAGLAFAVTAAQRGHEVTLFDKDTEIGGQFNLAKRIPGKEEFYETIRYFNSQLVKYPNLTVKLNTVAAKDDLVSFDSVVLATGVHPRKVDIPVKTDKVTVHSYYDVLKGRVKTGERVAVIGAGGIGFDMCEFLLGHGEDKPNGPLVPKVEEHRVNEYLAEWGIDTAVSQGGLLKQHSHKVTPTKKLYLLQRKPGRLGTSLGKTTGWIHKAQVKRHQVEELGGCKYVEINDEGLVIEQKQSSGKGKGKSDDNAPAVKRTLPVDTVVICAGQVPSKELYDPLVKAGKNVFLIGGSQEASELDAKRAIDQGTRLAAVVEDAKTGDVFSAPVENNTKIMDFIRKLVGKA
jgi:2,4-dienoyl-CoA reductase (NADPH2)